MRLYELAGSYADLAQRADDGEDVSDLLEQLEGELAGKAEQIARLLRNLGGDVDALDNEIKRLTHRRKSAENNIGRLRDYLRTQLEVARVSRLKTDTFSLSVGEGPERVEILNESLIPDVYCKTKREPSKTAIMAAYQTTGEVLPGCRIERGIRLTIR